MMEARNAGGPASFSDNESIIPASSTPLSVIISELLQSWNDARTSLNPPTTSLGLTSPTTKTIPGSGPSSTTPFGYPSSSSSSSSTTSNTITPKPSTLSTSTYAVQSEQNSSSKSSSSHHPPLPTPTVSTSSNHLSTGSLVAAILVPILAVLLLSAFFLWLLRRRRNNNNSHSSSNNAASRRHASSASTSSILPSSLKEKFSRNGSADINAVVQPAPVVATAPVVPDSISAAPIPSQPPILPPLPAAHLSNHRDEPLDLCVGDFGLMSQGSFGGLGGANSASGSGGAAAAMGGSSTRAGSGPAPAHPMLPVITSAQNNSYFTGLDTGSSSSPDEVGEEEEVARGMIGHQGMGMGMGGMNGMNMGSGMNMGMGMGMGMGMPMQMALHHHHHHHHPGMGMGMGLFSDPPPPYVQASQEGQQARDGERRVVGEEAMAGEGKSRGFENESRGGEGFLGVEDNNTLRGVGARPGTPSARSERSITSTLYSDSASVHSARATRVSTGAPLVVTPQGGRREEARDPFDDPSSSGSSAANSVGDLSRRGQESEEMRESQR